MEIFKKGSISFLYCILSGILGFGIQFSGAKILGASEFGECSYFMGLVNTLGLIFTFGIAFYFPKIFQNKIDKRTSTSGVFYTTIISLIIISLFINIPSQIDNYILFLMSFSLIFLGFYRSYLIGISCGYIVNTWSQLLELLKEHEIESLKGEKLFEEKKQLFNKYQDNKNSERLMDAIIII